MAEHEDQQTFTVRFPMLQKRFFALHALLMRFKPTY
jgi:hypothetical protein